MEISAAKKWVFFTSLILIVLSLLSYFSILPHFLPGEKYMQNFWLAFLGWALLALGNSVKGL